MSSQELLVPSWERPQLKHLVVRGEPSQTHERYQTAERLTEPQVPVEAIAHSHTLRSPTSDGAVPSGRSLASCSIGAVLHCKLTYQAFYLQYAQ